MNEWQEFWKRQHKIWAEQYKDYTIDELWEEYSDCLDDRIDHYFKGWLWDEIKRREKELRHG